MHHRHGGTSPTAPLPTQFAAARPPAPARPAAPRHRRFSLLAALAALLVWGAVTTSVLHHYHRAQHVAGGGTCRARLERQGVDIGAASAAVVDESAAALRAAARRHRAYALMAAALPANGLRLGGEVTQGLTMADLFQRVPPDSAAAAAHRDLQRHLHRAGGRALDSGELGSGGFGSASGGGSTGGVGSGHEGGGSPRLITIPKLRALDIPVRAVVLPMLDHAAASAISEAAARQLAGVLAEGSVWWQDPGLFHATLYHVSTHGAPVNATLSEVDQEAAAVRRVAHATCPIRATLERVVATAGGALVACWQVLPGSGEPEELRANLRHSLPRAPPPARQAIQEPAMLHTTVARVLSPPRRPPGAGPEALDGPEARAGPEADASDLAEDLAAAADALTDELCGLETAFDELWFVEELDLLALALQGRYKKRQSLLKCPGNDGGTASAGSNQGGSSSIGGGSGSNGGSSSSGNSGNGGSSSGNGGAGAVAGANSLGAASAMPGGSAATAASQQAAKAAG